MTIEIAIILCAVAAIACYLVYRWQTAVVDMAIPPYQEPVEDVVEPTALNPQATWPFPHGDKP
jgi:hypothetical protein